VGVIFEHPLIQDMR